MIVRWDRAPYHHPYTRIALAAGGVTAITNTNTTAVAGTVPQLRAQRQPKGMLKGVPKGGLSRQSRRGRQTRGLVMSHVNRWRGSRRGQQGRERGSRRGTGSIMDVGAGTGTLALPLHLGKGGRRRKQGRGGTSLMKTPLLHFLAR